jgi:cobalt/nickel transport protein
MLKREGMFKKIVCGPLLVLSLIGLCGSAFAHFGMVIPSDSMVMQNEGKGVRVTLSFSHHFEGKGMELEMPKVFSVLANGKRENLQRQLKKTKVMGHTGWEAIYTVKRPGIYMFYMEPMPYWEPAEDCFIIHYTKTVVAAFGYDEGWDQEIGLKTEIVPLSKPFGLYTGNVFQGIVKLNGKAVPHAEVEVAYYNQYGRAEAPTDYMVTQTIKADRNGVFTCAVPRAGWWGFAALNIAEKKMKHEGKEKKVEIGAVMWVRFHDWREK